MSRTHQQYRRRKPREWINPSEILDAVNIASAMKGCDCQPDIVRKHSNGIAMVEVIHDRACPAADAGRQVLFRKGTHQSLEEYGQAIAAALHALDPAAWGGRGS